MEEQEKLKGVAIAVHVNDLTEMEFTIRVGLPIDPMCDTERFRIVESYKKLLGQWVEVTELK